MLYYRVFSNVLHVMGFLQPQPSPTIPYTRLLVPTNRYHPFGNSYHSDHVLTLPRQSVQHSCIGSTMPLYVENSIAALLLAALSTVSPTPV
jgi:hypothetical protein